MITRNELIEALSLAYTTKENENKVVDATLIVAMVNELEKKFPVENNHSHESVAIGSIDKYQEAALETCAPTTKEMLDRIGYAAGAIRITVRELRATRLLERIDDIKKFIFYGKIPARPMYDHALPQHQPIPFKDVQSRVDLIHAILGIASETDELLEPLLKCLSPIDDEKEREAFLVNLAEEFGDIPWYLAAGCRGTGHKFSKVLAANIEKLHKKRFKNGFTEEAAKTRDLDAEYKSLRENLST